MAENKPDLPKLHEQLREFYASRQGEMKRADDMYNHDYAPLTKIPDGVQIHEASTGSGIIDGLRDQLHVDAPIVDFDPAGASAKARAEKSLMQMFGLHLLTEIPFHSVVDPFGQAALDFLLRGMACIKHLVNVEILPIPPDPLTMTIKEFRQAFKDYERKVPEVWPWIVKPIDPMSIYPAPGSQYPSPYILEVQERYASDVRSQYPHWSDPRRDRRRNVDHAARTTTWLEYWSEDWYIATADGEVVISEENPYKDEHGKGLFHMLGLTPAWEGLIVQAIPRSSPRTCLPT